MNDSLSPNARPILPALLADGRPATIRRVAFGDCDAFGMLYNVRFLDYVMNSRNEHLLDRYGIDVTTSFAKKRPLPATVSHQVTYLEPCRINEVVVISTNTVFVDPKGLTMEGVISSADGRGIKFHQWTRFRTLDPTTGAGSVITDEQVEDYRRTIAGPPIDPTDYDGRLRVVRSCRSL